MLGRLNRWFIFTSLVWLSSATLRAEVELPLASVSAIAVDINSGDLLLGKRADVVLPIASITKLMTALVVVESNASLDEWIKIQDWDKRTAKNAYSRIRLSSEARRRDLLRIALMSSENRAAYNLGASFEGGVAGLVQAMNEKAKVLGMTNTRFVDTSGLSLDNRSTARDLARLLVAAHAHQVLREYATTRSHTVNFRKPRYRLGYGNTNPLLGSSRWQIALSKTGYLTEAGRCLVMVTQMAGKQVGIVALNSLGKRSPLGDAGRIKRWLESGSRSTVAPAAAAHERRVSSDLDL